MNKMFALAQVKMHQGLWVCELHQLRLVVSLLCPFTCNKTVLNLKLLVFDILSPPLPVPVAARSNARTVFDRSNTGIVGSNRDRGMDVCPRFSILCRAVQVVALLWANPPSK
jgi:hypothetical protein